MSENFLRSTLYTLLGIDSDIQKHPKCGASWEGYALENILRLYKQDLCEFYFWSTEKEAELDLLVIRGDKRFAFEFKYSESQKLTKSMRITLNDLKLDNITIITPGNRTYALSDHVIVSNLYDLKQTVNRK